MIKTVPLAWTHTDISNEAIETYASKYVATVTYLEPSTTGMPQVVFSGVDEGIFNLLADFLRDSGHDLSFDLHSMTQPV